MVNGLMLWGNCQLLPHGPLREPLSALRRADIVVIHHADMVRKLFPLYLPSMKLEKDDRKVYLQTADFGTKTQRHRVNDPRN